MLEKIKQPKWILVSALCAGGAWGVSALLGTILTGGTLAFLGGIVPAVVGVAVARFGGLLAE
jgi:hypothetical protein